MIFVIINSILYMVGFLYFFGKKKFHYHAFIIYLLFFFSSIASVFLFDEDSRYFDAISFLPFVYLFLLFNLFSYPFFRLNTGRIHHIEVPSVSQIQLLSSVVIVIYVVYSLRYFGAFIDVVNGLLLDVTSADTLYTSNRGENKAGVDIIGVLGPSFRDIPVLLLFYIYLGKLKVKPIVKAGLIYSILIVVISGLARGQRQNFVFIFFELLFCYGFLKLTLPKRNKRRLTIGFSTIISLLLIPFVLLSIGRFSTGYSSAINPLYAFKSYAGQAMLNFNQWIFNLNGLRFGDRILNLFKWIVLPDTPFSWVERRQVYKHLNLDDDKFSTFIGDIIIDFGNFYVAIFALIFFIFHFLRKRKKGVISIPQMMGLYILWNTITHGLFLFTYADINGNIKIVLFLLILLFLKVTTKSKHYIPYGKT